MSWGHGRMNQNLIDAKLADQAAEKKKREEKEKQEQIARECKPKKYDTIHLYFDPIRMSIEIDSKAIECTCPKCKPALYMTSQCGHAVVDLSAKARNSRDKEVYVVPQLGGRWTYEGMDLAKKSIDYFGSTPNDTQSKAVDRLYALVTEHSELLKADDVSQMPDANHVLAKILGCINDICFFSAVPEIEAKWEIPASGGYGHTDVSPVDGRITMQINPVKVLDIPGQDPTRKKVLSRVATIFHEATHAYLMYFTCTSELCLTYHRSCGAGGHGRAFVYITTALEILVPRIWRGDFPVRFLSWDSYYKHMMAYNTLPSRCDLENIGRWCPPQDEHERRTAIEEHTFPYYLASRNGIKREYTAANKWTDL